MKIMLAYKCVSDDRIQILKEQICIGTVENSSKRVKNTFKEGGNRKNHYR